MKNLRVLRSDVYTCHRVGSALHKDQISTELVKRERGHRMNHGVRWPSIYRWAVTYIDR